MMTPAIPIPAISMADLLRAGDVKRWHTVPTVRAQTLAEHQYNVLVLTLALKADESAALNAVWSPGEAALVAAFHDAEEVHTGDTPSPFKEHEVPIGWTNRLVWVADAIEAYWWIYNNGCGSRHPIVVNDCYHRLKRRVADLLESGVGVWLVESVNKILRQLGMAGRV